jgi:hypothetical protein
VLANYSSPWGLSLFAEGFQPPEQRLVRVRSRSHYGSADRQPLDCSSIDMPSSFPEPFSRLLLKARVQAGALVLTRRAHKAWQNRSPQTHDSIL